MELRERILIDFKKFNNSLKSLPTVMDAADKEILMLADRYFKDSKYFLSKGDLPTSFGCITYAHGLIDSILIRYRLKQITGQNCSGAGLSEKSSTETPGNYGNDDS